MSSHPAQLMAASIVDQLQDGRETNCVEEKSCGSISTFAFGSISRFGVRSVFTFGSIDDTGIYALPQVDLPVFLPSFILL